MEEKKLIKNPLNRVFYKYLSAYLLISLIPLIIVWAASSVLGSRMLINETMQTLKSITNERTARIRGYMKAISGNAESAAIHPRLIKLMYNAAAGSKTSVEAAETGAELEHFAYGHGFYDILLIRPDGLVVETVKKEKDYGKNIFSEKLLKRTELAGHVAETIAEKKTSISGFDYYEPSKMYSMFITCPVMRGGEFLGVAAFQLENRDINSLTEDYNEAGKSGEMLVGVKKEDKILFITKQKRANKKAFETWVNPGGRVGVPMQLAVAGKTGAGIRQDYSGVKVLASWTYIHESGWGVVVKKDYSEVMAPVFRLNLIFFFIVLACAAVVAYIASRAAAAAVWPILVVADAAKKMAQGDLGARAIVNTGDEIQAVADNFNEMAAVLQKNAEKLNAVNEKLTAETKKTRHYLDISEALIVELDRKGDVLAVNTKVKDILGYSPQELTGRNWFDIFVPAEMKKTVQEPFEKMMAGEGGNIEYFENQLPAKSGEMKTIYWHNTLIKDKTGKIIKTLSSGIDITGLKKVEKELGEAEHRFEMVFEKSMAGKSLTAPDGKLLKINNAFAQMLGYTVEEMQSVNFAAITHPDDMAGSRECIRCLMAGERDNYRLEKRYIHKNKSIVWTDVSTSLLRDGAGKPLYFITTIMDTNHRKNMEIAVAESEEKFRSTFEQAQVGVVLVSGDKKFIKVNEKFCKITGYTAEELYAKTFPELTYKDDVEKDIAGVKEVAAGKRDLYQAEKRYVKKDGSIAWATTTVSAVKKDGKFVNFVAVIEDISLKKKAEELLTASEEKYRQLFTAMSQGLAVHEAIMDSDGRMIDYRFIDVNASYEKVTGWKRDEIIGKTIKQVLPGVESVWLETFGRVVKTGVAEYLEDYAAGLKKYYGTFTYRIKQDRFAVLVTDVTERRKMQEELKKTMQNLERSNKELEQFAFVASHDLQEPLRAVTGYIQLLEKKYLGRLDKDADRYLKEVVDGSGRMRALINDLLAFSRIESKVNELKEIDMNAVFDTVIYGLGKAMSESSAEITKDRLPKVMADEIHMVQLLQNLIGNGIKFHGANKPQIHVSAKQEGKEIVFSVKDNGIGIEKEYYEKIFVIFQRLHGREEYPGTGIGLAICKKIVERHNGRIWVESEPGKGSTFYFTLPGAG